jgi:hypothetical protein
MSELIVNKKTGFRVNDVTTPVIIRDFRGMLFYTTESLIPKVKYFNLPPLGRFYLDSGNITPLKHPIKRKLAKLPTPERFRRPPFDFQVQFGNNPNKCTIFWDQKKILFDNAFKSKSLSELYFVLFHEYGHALYGTEKYADLVATNLMKIRGFNTSQIGDAPLFTLSAIQLERKKFIIDKLIKTIRK